MNKEFGAALALVRRELEKNGKLSLPVETALFQLESEFIFLEKKCNDLEKDLK